MTDENLEGYVGRVSEYLGIDASDQQEGRMWVGVSPQHRRQISICSNIVGLITGVLAYFALRTSDFSADLGFLHWLLPLDVGLTVSLLVSAMGNSVARRAADPS